MDKRGRHPMQRGKRTIDHSEKRHSDTEKYLKLIEDRNREIQKEKDKEKLATSKETSIYANRQTEIKINKEYFEKMGIPLEDDAEDKPKEENKNPM